MDSGLRIPEPPVDAGGLIVMVRPDPALAARAIADDLHADLAIGGEATERAIERLHSRQLEHHDLAELAAAMRRAEAIRDRTRAAESTRLSTSLNTKVAIHPDTLVRAATELLAAELALAAALEEDRRTTRRRRRIRVSGSTTAIAGAAVVVLVAAPVGAAIAAAGAAGASASWIRARRSEPRTHESLRAHCELARSRWEQVAGVGADPAEVDDLIRRYDPQDRVVADLVQESPALRTAERAVLERRMAWVSAWRREVGDSTPIADPAITQLLGRDRTELWLGVEADPLGDPDTLVVAAPYADLPEARARDLHRRLLGLPRGQRVIVVLAPDPDAPTGVRIPGVGWVPAIS